MGFFFGDVCCASVLEHTEETAGLMVRVFVRIRFGFRRDFSLLRKTLRSSISIRQAGYTKNDDNITWKQNLFLKIERLSISIGIQISD